MPANCQTACKSSSHNHPSPALPTPPHPNTHHTATPNKQDGFACVHFGALRVVDDAARALTLRNTGRYDVAFRFIVASQLVADLVGITPGEGALQPGKEVTVAVSRV